jgi:hypothetical protein
MNVEAEGTVYPDVPFEVDPVRVQAFRDIFGLEEGVPPTFITVAEFAAYPQVIDDPNLGLDFSHVVHGSQEYAFTRPLREGETLAGRTRIESIKVMGRTSFLTVVMDFRGGSGDIVVTARSTMIERGSDA